MDKVWVATWDVRNSDSGCEVFSTKEKAVNAVLEWADFMEEEGVTLDEARRSLEEDFSLGFDDRECWYSIDGHEVQ